MLHVRARKQGFVCARKKMHGNYGARRRTATPGQGDTQLRATHRLPLAPSQTEGCTYVHAVHLRCKKGARVLSV